MLGHKMADSSTPGQSRADALMLVQSHGHAVSGAAKGDAKVYLMGFHGVCQGVGVVRIVYACLSVSAKIHNLYAAGAQHFDKLEFVLHACVVVADTYFHIIWFKLRFQGQALE